MMNKYLLRQKNNDLTLNNSFIKYLLDGKYWLDFIKYLLLNKNESIQKHLISTIPSLEHKLANLTNINDSNY